MFSRPFKLFHQQLRIGLFPSLKFPGARLCGQNASRAEEPEPQDLQAPHGVALVCHPQGLPSDALPCVSPYPPMPNRCPKAAYAPSIGGLTCTPPPVCTATTNKDVSIWAATSCAHRWPMTACTFSPRDKVQVDFKRPWSDGTSSIVLDAQALIARLAAIVPPPRRHVTRYFGVLSSHSALRRLIVPTAAAPGDLAAAPAERDDTDAVTAPKPARKSKYIAWHELLRRTFGIDVVCTRCHGSLRLIALVKEQPTITKILGAMGLDTTPPKLASATAPPHQEQLDWCN